MAFWKWINRHNRLYAILSGVLVGGLTLAYYIALGRDTVFHWDSIVLFVTLTVVLVFLVYYAMRVESLAVIQIRQNCDPEPLLESARQLRARRNPRRRTDRPVWFGSLLNEMAALSDLGRLDEADACLNEAEPWLSKMHPTYQALFKMDRTCLYLMQKKPDLALPVLQQCEVTVEQLSAQKKNMASWQTSLAMNQWEYRFQTDGPSEELLAQIRERAAAQDTPYLQIALQCKLAQCLLALNRREEAFPYLHFVAQNGGKLWQRAWALEQLSAGFPSEIS